MEWASGIEWSDKGYIARIEDEDKEWRVPLKKLVSSGVPDAKTTRIVVDQPLDTWCESDPAEYVHAFSSRLTPSSTGHAVYASAHEGIRSLVPALVFMRALFRPTRHLLPALCGPQALDRIRYSDFSQTPPIIKFYRKTWANLGRRYADVSTTVSWLSSFPSAVAFAGSVHLNAQLGRIAVTLPLARARLALRGVRAQGTLFATSAVLLELNATEKPFTWAEGHTLKIYKRNTSMVTGPFPILQSLAVPLRPDGSVDVTDEEWLAIAPVLIPKGNHHRFSAHNPRLLLDGILRKLAFGTAWRSTPYRTGKKPNAQYAYRTWRSSGTLEKVNSILRDRRGQA